MAITVFEDRKNEGFNQWLATQTSRKDLVGKFARWINFDKCWPQDADDYVILRSHIRARHHNNSYTSRIAAFEVAWEEYQSLLDSKKIIEHAQATNQQIISGGSGTY